MEMDKVALFHDRPELLAAFRDGRRDVLGRVYSMYALSIERYLRVLALAARGGEGVQASVADLVQEVFIRAFSPNARRAYDGVRDYRSYLTAIARNCHIDMLRGSSREVLTDPADLPSDLDTFPEPDDWCEPKILVVLNAYLDDLSDTLRCVYEQRFVLAKSQAQASSDLGISRRALRTSEQKLRKGLRRALVRAGILLRDLGPSKEVFSTERPRVAMTSRGGL
jgi:RNA polymerase sigma factor (sigma-70 family)